MYWGSMNKVYRVNAISLSRNLTLRTLKDPRERVLKNIFTFYAQN